MISGAEGQASAKSSRRPEDNPEQVKSLIHSFESVNATLAECVQKLETLRLGMAMMGVIPRTTQDFENHPIIEAIVNRAVSNATHRDRQAVCVLLKELRAAMPVEFEYASRPDEEFDIAEGVLRDNGEKKGDSHGPLPSPTVQGARRWLRGVLGGE